MNKIQNHSPKPYTIIEDSLLDCNLSIYEKMVLISIIKYAGKANRAWPGVKTIAANAGISERQARRILRHLEKIDLLRTESRSGRTSLYHIPQFIVVDGQISGKWSGCSTPGSQSGATPAHQSPTPDSESGRSACQSPEYYQGKVSKKNSLSHSAQSPPSPAPQKSKPARDFFDTELITTWSQHFSIEHTPQNLKEQTAMDWMLFAATNNQLGQINSPIGYLKAITRQGHSADFTPFQEKKELEAKAQIRAAQQKQKRSREKKALEKDKILAREKYENLPEPEKTKFINDFRNYLIDTGNRLVVKRFDEGGISPGMIEALFGSFINEKMIPANREQPLERLSKSFFIKLPLKSPPTPRELQC